MAAAKLSRAFLILGICVCLASTALSGFCGSLAGLLYGSLTAMKHYQPPRPAGTSGPGATPEASETPEAPPSSEVDFAPEDERAATAGAVIGAVGGLGAGLLWVRIMRRKTLQTLAKFGWLRPGLIGFGVVVGLVVGVAATVLLHVTLALLTGQADQIFYGVLEGLFFGVPAGAGLGLLSGIVWHLVCGIKVGRAGSDATTEEPSR